MKDKEHQNMLRNFTLSQYLGKKCIYCSRVYYNLDILESSEPVCARTNPIELACKVCFDDKNKDANVSGDEQ